MTPNKEYWMERALTREQEAYLRGTLLNKRMFNEYQKAADKLKKSIQSFYGKYATKHGLTYEEAMRKLTAREAREWKATLGEYVADINAAADPKVKADLTAQLDALSANSQISRLEALLADAQAQMDVMYERCREELTSGFGEIYTESYYHKHYDIQSRVGWVSEVTKLTPSMIQDAVSYPWSGAMFSDRLWQNKNALVFNIREIITQSLIQGKNLPETSKALSNKMGQSYKVAERLVRTETSHLHNRADLTAYEAAGVTEYEYMATMDERTCEVCGALDGKHFPIKDATPGVNFPPMHPNDRCTTVEYDPEDAADWEASGEKMPESMTYEEWKNRQGIAAEAPRNTGKRVKYNPDADFSITLDGYDNTTLSGLSDASFEVAQLGAKDGLEHLCLVDLENGSILFRETGEESQVGGPLFWSILEQNPNKRFAFVHNHPTDGCFSETDMRTLLSNNPVEMFIAVRHDGIRYIAEKSSTPSETVFFDSLYQSEIDVLNRQVKDGIITAGERTKLREELIVDNLIRDYTRGLVELGS